jgi:hypothetical protein
MARRNAQVEAPAEDTTTEAPAEEQASTTTEAPAEAKAEVEIDLTDFKAAAEQAVSEADTSTGDLPTASIDAVNKVYREIDGVKGKNQARAWIEEQMKASIVAKDIMKARAFVELKDGLSAGSGGGGTKAPADPTQAFVNKAAALMLALNEVESNVPEGVSEDWSTKLQELLPTLEGEVASYRQFLASDDEDAEAPEVSPVVRQAFKLASGRGSGGGSGRVSGGPRRDIEKHLVQVFADLEVGSFLTINEIAKASSTEYGDDRPSAGAVSARLFPKGRDAYSANGIQATNEDGKVRGATKVA